MQKDDRATNKNNMENVMVWHDSKDERKVKDTNNKNNS